MDITPVFKASIRTVKTRKKSYIATENGNKGALNLDNNILFKSRDSKSKSDFNKKAKEVVSNISQLKEFLLKYRQEYIDMSLYESESGGDGMTNEERDEIDGKAEQFIKLCNDTIHSLYTIIKSNPSSKLCSSKQTIENRQAIISLVEQYLKVVVKLYSEQKAIRVKKVVDQKTLARLEPSESARKRLDKKVVEPTSSATAKARKSDLEQSNSTKVIKTLPPDEGHLTDDTRPQATDLDLALSPHEIQMLEQENNQLYDELNCMVDEVKQIEGKVVEISKLQEIFTDKVLEQDVQIEQVATTTVTTTENIKEGNEQVRKSIEQRAGIRVYILFFLIIMSFALLFLDWYNP